MSRPPLPPFSAETAAQKARLAEDAWNTRDPSRVALAYTTDSIWRNRAEFIHGREQIEAFLTRKWNRELDYRLIKEVWTFRDNRIAVRFAAFYRPAPTRLTPPFALPPALCRTAARATGRGLSTTPALATQPCG